MAMFRLRNRVLAGSLTAAALMLAGCSGGTGDAASSSAATQGKSPAPGATEAAATSSAVASDAAAGDLSGTVYVLLPNTTARWEKWDAPYIVDAFAKLAPGLEVKTLNANGDAALQAQQMDTALASGAKAVILAAQDTPSSGGMLAKAADAGVPVISYMNGAGPGEVKYNVGFPLDQLGAAGPEYLASHLPAQPRPFRLAMILGDPNWDVYKAEMDGFKKFLGPLVDDGTIKIVCQADTIGWVPAEAQKNMEQCLTKTDGGIDGVFGMNDDTLTAAWAAITSQGLQDKVKVLGGIDGTLPALQRVLAEQQIEDLVPDYLGLAEGAAQATLAAINGTPAPEGLINSSVDNGVVQGGVPTALIPSVLVSLDNFQQTVIDTGLWGKDDICKDMTAATAFCG
jgi:D-xylose transport system substrate-binding protein